MYSVKVLVSWLAVCSALAFPLPLLAGQPDFTLTGHSGSVIEVAFSHDGTRIASASEDGKLKVWDVASKKETFTFEGTRTLGNNIRFTPGDKSIVALGSEDNVVIIDAANGKLVRAIALPAFDGGPAALDLSPDGATVAVVGRGKLRLLNLVTGAVKADLSVHAGYGVTAVAFSPDGALIATAGTDNTALVIDPAAAKVVHAVKLGLNGVAVALSADARTLFVSSTDQVLQSFDLRADTVTKLVDKNVPIFKVALSTDGKTLIMAGPGHGPWTVSLPDGAVADPVFDSEEWVKSAAMSPDGHWLAGGGNGGSVFLWKNGN